MIPRAAIFSIDYRLAPNSKFPDQVEDCWQAYVWIILNAKQVFGIDFKNVVLVGDSAGGNLVISITVMAIKRGFRKPDALKPCYPSTIASPDSFWPSILCAIDDSFLSQGMLVIF